MATGIKDELKALYGDSSKHSVYQSVPDFVSEALGYSEAIDEGWRGDKPRLRYLCAVRRPADGETWGDFGANTGFFTLSLAHDYPTAHFTAIEANPNHARFIRRVAEYFGIANVQVLDHAIGLRELHDLPRFDFLLHLNVLHHAGHDFDRDLVHGPAEFPAYAVSYLQALRTRVSGMLFQLGSNWGGDKAQPLIGTREDAAKLRFFRGWLVAAGWRIEATAYPRKSPDRTIDYQRLTKVPDGRSDAAFQLADDAANEDAIDPSELDVFPGEFYRRPLFLCAGEGLSIQGTDRSTPKRRTRVR